MQAELAAEAPIVLETYAEASEVLGFDLWDLVQSGPKERLDETVNTQPAMLTAGVATWRAWRQAGGPHPQMMAGHSLGEYSALVAAGSLDFPSALRIVQARAQFMRDAVPPGEGAMAAVLGLDDEAILDICERSSGIGVAEAVNFNSPGQVVVAGHKRAVEQTVALAKDAGARRAIMLAVSVPSHSSLMRPAGDQLATLIDSAGFSDPSIAVICAVDGKAYGDVADIKRRIKAQVYSPVRWTDTVRTIASGGSNAIFECGPGKVLAGLIRRIDRDISSACIDSRDTLQSTLSEVNA